MLCYFFSMRRGVRQSGSALMVVMFLALILLFMVKMLVMLAASQTTRSLTYCNRASALYVVDAAVADAINQLSKNASWTTGFQEKKLTRAEGVYSLKFHTGPGAVEFDESVNNLQGGVAADGFRGPGTVPPGCAELVIRAEVGGVIRSVRVIVSGTPVATGSAGMVAGGNLVMRGNVFVDGITTMASGGTSTKAHLQSNRSDAAPDIVRWSPVNPGDRAVVDGEVRVSSSDPGAINFGPDPTAYQVDAFQTGAAGAALSKVDVIGQIAAHSGDQAPSINPLATNNLGSGSFYYNGDLTINGDLNMDDTKLYVSGKLTVNGTIAGRGSVYVGGDTDFQGDGAVYSNNLEGVALFSQGNVHLTGLDGSAYMDAVVAGNPAAAKAWQDMKDTVADFKTNAAASIAKSGDLTKITSYTDGMRTVLGTDSNSNHQPWQGRTRDATGQLMTYLQGQPQSSTRDFMLERLNHMQFIFADPANNPYTPGHSNSDVYDEWASGGHRFYGILDCVINNGNSQQIEQTLNTVMRLDNTRLGTSYFQGKVYTNGYFYASNEVTIVGSLVSGGNRTGAPTMLGSVEVRDGDIVLDNNSRLTLCEDYSDTPTGGGGASSFGTRCWIEL